MRLVPRTCIELHCDGGCEDQGWHGGTPHFGRATDALAYARSCGWVLDGDVALCPDCALAAECRVYGHRWDLWHERQDMGVPYRRRNCVHCGDHETDPPFDVLCQQAQTIRDAEDIIRAVIR